MTADAGSFRGIVKPNWVKDASGNTAPENTLTNNPGLSVGEFLFGTEPKPGWGAYGSLAWGDYNKDGNLDIAIAGSDLSYADRFRIFKNKGDGSFENNPVEPEPGWGVDWGTVAWGDYNNDG